MATPARPIRLVVRDDDLHRNRLTVFFRLLLAIPHFVWLTLWGIAALVASFVMWLAILIDAKAPSVIHDFLAGYARYATHVSAYLFLAANPYPGFRGRPGYPVDLEIEPPARQSRLSALVRIVLALPALALAASLGGGLSLGVPSGSWGTTSGEEYGTFSTISVTGVAAAAAFLAWFAILALGRAPRGLRDLVVYTLGYAAQASGYLFLLTGRYPDSNPALAEEFAELPDHPVKVVVADDLERPRLTVIFRLLLAIPHFVWLLLWSIAAFFAVLIAWFAALFAGRVPASLHRFLAAYVRYGTHVFAFTLLTGRRFPGFTGAAGSYGIDIEIAPPERQNRWKTLFRLFLAIPAFILASALDGVAFVAAFLAWWYALVTGRMPEGLRNLGVACLRYGGQTYAYAFLLTDRYPYASPILEPPRRDEDDALLPADTGPAPVPLPAAGEKRGTNYVAVAIVSVLVLVGAGLALAGLRALAEPTQGVLRVLAPPDSCWTVTAGRSEDQIGILNYSGCGVTAIEFDASDTYEAQLSTQPPGAHWDFGATILVDDEVVRRVAPAPRGGFRVRHGDDIPEKTIVVRVDAEDGGCWSAAIDNTVERGCGSRSFPLDVVGTFSIVLERDEPGTWPIALAFEADGRVVQTYGPDTGEYPFISGVYVVPREDG